MSTVIPMQDCRQLAAELLSQPDLLAPVFADDRESLPENAGAVSPLVGRYTGELSTRDESRLLLVGALHLLGASEREIERQCGVTRRTIPVLLAELERSGRITPLKERLAMVTGANAERAQLALSRLLNRAVDGECSQDLAGMIKSLAVTTGVTTEKVLLLTGQATERVEHIAGAGRAEFESWWRDQVRDVTPAIDAVSVGPVLECSAFGAASSFDAAGAAPVPASDPMPADLGADAGTGERAAAEAGGGVLRGAAGGNV